MRGIRIHNYKRIFLHSEQRQVQLISILNCETNVKIKGTENSLLISTIDCNQNSIENTTDFAKDNLLIIYNGTSTLESITTN